MLISNIIFTVTSLCNYVFQITYSVTLAHSVYDNDCNYDDDNADDNNDNDDNYDGADADNLVFRITCSVILPRAAGLNSSRASHHRGISY